jgi:uncharacterized MAPEG superfamily protein
MASTHLIDVYAVSTAVLFFKMQGIGFYQGFVRTKSKSFSNPEDAKAFKGELSTQEHPDVERANKAYRNDLENIPMFLLMSLGYIMLTCPEKAGVICIMLFTFARIMHTVTYLKGMQPWRTIAYAIGLFCSAFIALNILYKVLVAS